LFWNALGGLTWGVTMCLMGYFAGASYQEVAWVIGEGTAVVIALLAITGLIVWRVRRKRREESREAEYATTAQATQSGAADFPD
jgi:membrane-associated protein